MPINKIIQLTGLPVLLASLCCLAPVILVMLGLSTTSFALSLSDTLYYDYRWAFRILGLITLAGSLWFYFRKQGICTLDDVKRHRNKVINTLMLVLVVSVSAYIVWLYFIVDWFGILLGIWQ